MAKHIDLTGLKFSRLTVLGLNGRNPGGYLLWKCRCECGNNFDATADHLKSGNTRSCGCLYKDANKKRIGTCRKDYTPYFGQKINYLTVLSFGDPDKKGRKTFKCECRCGKIKELLVTWVINERIKSCGCYRLEVVKSITGPRHHNWNKNKSQEERERDRKNRRNREWACIKWRNLVFKRDNYTCQSCGSFGGKLQAHHLNCWVNFPNERYDIDNGLCLCVKCHKLFHKAYGLKTTKDMFDEYVK